MAPVEIPLCLHELPAGRAERIVHHARMMRIASGLGQVAYTHTRARGWFIVVGASTPKARERYEHEIRQRMGAQMELFK